MGMSAIGSVGGARRDKSSVSPAGRRIFPKRGENTGIDSTFKHRDLFQKAQDREQKADWYTQFQESKEKFHQVGMGEQLPSLGDLRNLMNEEKTPYQSSTKKLKPG